jgi:hypothetical protein
LLLLTQPFVIDLHQSWHISELDCMPSGVARTRGAVATIAPEHSTMRLPESSAVVSGCTSNRPAGIIIPNYLLAPRSSFILNGQQILTSKWIVHRPIGASVHNGKGRVIRDIRSRHRRHA